MANKINRLKIAMPAEIEETAEMLHYVVNTLEDAERPLRAAFCAGVLLRLDMIRDEKFLKMLGLKKIEDYEEE